MTRLRSAASSVLPGLLLLLASSVVKAEKLKMPEGMGGVPDIGAIPCSVFNEMMKVAPLGTRHSLLTWSAGHLQALSGKSLQEIVDGAHGAGGAWTYEKLTAELSGYCAANPKAITRDAAASLARQLGVTATSP